MTTGRIFHIFRRHWILWLLVLGLFRHAAFADDALRGFEYREITINFVQSGGTPVAGASIYGFCREFNLLWPRRDHEMAGRNDVIWDESFLGKTGLDGSVKVTVPPGKWGFFAAARSPKGDGGVVAAWTDFRQPSGGETVRLSATVEKRWTFCSAASNALDLKQIFLKPSGYPIWIPVNLAPMGEPKQIELSDGRMEIWADGDATGVQPGFALAFGEVNNRMSDGNILPTGSAEAIDCHGGTGRAALSWTRWGDFGLQGELKLSDNAQVLFSRGNFTVGYRRPLGVALTAVFVGQLAWMEPGRPGKLDFDGALAAGVDAQLEKADKTGARKLDARLFLVDKNGHLLAELLDASGRQVSFGAVVTVGGKHFVAQQLQGSLNASENHEVGQTMFEANVGTIASAADAIWNFTAPRGVLQESSLPADEKVTVASATFYMPVPEVIQSAAQNTLAQAEMLAADMAHMSDRRRRIEQTKISVTPGDAGAAATHSGVHIAIGTKLFYSGLPAARHDLAHELAHNFNFTHGGLMETVVETSRCASGEQISQQPAKWFFWDRMNGDTRKETGYHNVGLYLYCYAQGGLDFLHFMSNNEPAVLKNMGKEGYTADELETALCGFALQRDMTPICRKYGLAAAPDRVAQILRDPQLAALKQ
jgi:hypothetical protein